MWNPPDLNGIVGGCLRLELVKGKEALAAFSSQSLKGHKVAVKHTREGSGRLLELFLAGCRALGIQP